MSQQVGDEIQVIRKPEFIGEVEASEFIESSSPMHLDGRFAAAVRWWRVRSALLERGDFTEAVQQQRPAPNLFADSRPRPAFAPT